MTSYCRPKEIHHSVLSTYFPDFAFSSNNNTIYMLGNFLLSYYVSVFRHKLMLFNCSALIKT